MDKPELNIDIELTEPVGLTFSLKYLVNFCKAQALSSTVKICLSNEVPLLVEYGLAGSSYLRFYLAPKVRRTILFIPLSFVSTNISFSFRSATRSKRLGVTKRNENHDDTTSGRKEIGGLSTTRSCLRTCGLRIWKHGHGTKMNSCLQVVMALGLVGLRICIMSTSSEFRV